MQPSNQHFSLSTKEDIGESTKNALYIRTAVYQKVFFGLKQCKVAERLIAVIELCLSEVISWSATQLVTKKISFHKIF